MYKIPRNERYSTCSLNQVVDLRCMLFGGFESRDWN